MQAFHRAIEDEAERYWPITAEKLRGFGKWRATSTYVNPEDEMLDLLVRTLDGEFGPRRVEGDRRVPRRAAENARKSLKSTAVLEGEDEKEGRLVVKLPISRENLESLTVREDIQRIIPAANKPANRKRKMAVASSLERGWLHGFSKPGPKKKRKAEAWERLGATAGIVRAEGDEEKGPDEVVVAGAVAGGALDIVPQGRGARKGRRMVVAGGDEEDDKAKEEKARALMAQRRGIV